MNEIPKARVQLEKSVKNTQRTLYQVPHGKERIRPILDCPVHCL